MNKANKFLNSRLFNGLLICTVTLFGFWQLSSSLKVDQSQNLLLSETVTKESIYPTQDEKMITEQLAPEQIANIEEFTTSTCQVRLIYGYPSSSTPKQNPSYYLSFVRQSALQNQFQDVNGDTLPDYIWVENDFNRGSGWQQSTHQSCVYLNNGSGWEKTSECYARKRIDEATGNLLEQEYRGDCAQY